MPAAVFCRSPSAVRLSSASWPVSIWPRGPVFNSGQPGRRQFCRVGSVAPAGRQLSRRPLLCLADDRITPVGAGSGGRSGLIIAAAKCKLTFSVAFIRAILCNWLVCQAVFMATAARDVGSKMLACYVPIMTFVTSGFEHSIANIVFYPLRPDDL